MSTTSETRKQISFRLPEYLIEALKEEAKKCQLSLNSYVVITLRDSIEWEPNEETRRALYEAEHDIDLEILDMAHFDEFVKSL